MKGCNLCSVPAATYPVAVLSAASPHLFFGPVWELFLQAWEHTPPFYRPISPRSYNERCDGLAESSCPGWEQLQQPLPGIHVKQLLLLLLPSSLPCSSPAQSKGGAQHLLNTAATSLQIYHLPWLPSRKATFIRPYQRGRKYVCIYMS